MCGKSVVQLGTQRTGSTVRRSGSVTSMPIKCATIWDEAASEALREFEEGAPNETETLNPGNALVVCFLL